MKTTTSSGVSLSTVLLAIFITLKLCKVIDWSWWWVLSPIWIVWGLVLLILGACLLIVALFSKD